MKKVFTPMSVAVLVAMGVLTYDQFRNDSPAPERPQRVERENDREMDPNKNRAWTSEEREEHTRLLEEKLRNRATASRSRSASGLTTIANGAVTGNWISRGPVGAPGAFEFCEIDDGTDTVYAVSTGHYGGVRNIFKGTIAFSANDTTGDDLQMISGQFPQRWKDIHVYMVDGVKRLLGTVADGAVYYSDDMGKNWTKSTGLTATMKGTIRNRQENDRLYTCDARRVYVSDDAGASFTVLHDFGTTSVMRLYTPRYDHQPGSDKVFLFREGKVWVLNGSSFSVKGTFDMAPAAIRDDATVQLNGDERYLYAYYQKTGEKEAYFMVSTDAGATFVRRHPRNSYYSAPSGTAAAFSFFGVHPDTPSTAILGYAHPTISLDGGQRDIVSSEAWYEYQLGHTTWDNQTAKLRRYYHPDFQGGHFFYDKNGELFSLRAGDGGLFVSRNEWEEGHYPGDYYNFTVHAPVSNGETYGRGMVSGFKGEVDFALGTQDQGWQTSIGLFEGTTQAKVIWDGGDGGQISNGPDGEYCWEITSKAVVGPLQLYSGDTFLGVKPENRNKLGTRTAVTVRGHWFDLKDYSSTVWILNNSINKFVTNGSGGHTQTSVYLPGITGNIAALCQSPANKSIFWAMAENKVFKSTDGGTTFAQTATVNMSASIFGGDVRGWAFDDNTVLFAGKGTGGSSIISTDGGTSFSAVEGIPENVPVYWMQGDKSGSIAMASTKVGPYLFDLAQKQWFDAAGDPENGAPYFSGQWGAYDSSRNVFRFSTWGQGVWDFAVSDGAPKLTVSGVEKQYNAGDTVALEWTTNLTGTAALDFLADGSSVETIASVDLSSGEYLWEVPDHLEAGVRYSFRVTHADMTAETSSFILMLDYLLLDQKHLSIDTVDSEDNYTMAAEMTIDGKPNTIWQTLWGGNSEPTYPHFIVYEVDTTVDLAAFQYVPRQALTTGIVNEYEIQLSDDGENWITVLDGQIEPGLDGYMGYFTEIQSARYVKFLAKSEINGNNWASMAEFNLYYIESDQGAVAQKPATDTKLNAIQLAGVSAKRIQLAIPADGTYKIQLHSIDGRLLFNSNRSMKAGVQTVDLSSAGLARQFGLLSVTGENLNLTRKITLK